MYKYDLSPQIIQAADQWETLRLIINWLNDRTGSTMEVHGNRTYYVIDGEVFESDHLSFSQAMRMARDKGCPVLRYRHWVTKYWSMLFEYEIFEKAPLANKPKTTTVRHSLVCMLPDEYMAIEMKLISPWLP
jgi:hypothetical protein